MRAAAVAAGLLASIVGAAPLSASSEPVAYAAVVAAEASAPETVNARIGSFTATDETEAAARAELTEEQADLMAGDPDWEASARLYHAGGGGATGNDSLGCRPIAMRTVAVDPRIIPRRTRLFIRETVGLLMADGTRHDGYWYASDTGGAIKGAKIDLYTGHGRGSMAQARRLNMRTLTIADAGRFDGCPPSWEARPAARRVQMASTETSAGVSQ
jgi:3D (Asp-Asp-Asp) domain-containing protein